MNSKQDLKPKHQGLIRLANEFFNMPVSDQDAWTKKEVGVSAITFRRWIAAANITKQVVIK